MVGKNPFTKEQGAYLDYIQRWKATGEGLPIPCCLVHRGEEPTKRIRFPAFCDHLRKLGETEFYLVGLRNEDKTRGGHYPKLVKEQRELQALLLIEPDKEEKEAKEAEDANNKSTPALLEEAIEIEDKLANERDERRRPDLTKPEKEGDDGMVTA